MKLRILQLPYDSGHRDRRMGLGPAHFVRHGAGSQLRALGHEVDAETVDLGAGPATFPTEIATSFALYRALAGRVAETVAEGALPVVLAGNCGSALGTVAGLGRAHPASEVAVVWLDAHADFNTPETTESGFLDGMALAALTGRCWGAMTAGIPGFRPVAEAQTILVGTRDVDPGELTALEGSLVRRVGVEAIRERGIEGALAPVVAALARRVHHLYLHVDLDVLDPDAVGRANALAAPGGLTLAEAQTAVAAAARTGRLAAICLASYDPTYDERADVWRAGVALLEAALGSRPSALG